MKGILYEDI
jgi:hypothetical protein